MALEPGRTQCALALLRDLEQVAYLFMARLLFRSTTDASINGGGGAERKIKEIGHAK